MSSKVSGISFNLRGNVKVLIKKEFQSKTLNIMKHLKFVCENQELIILEKDQYMYFSPTRKFGLFEDSDLFEICFFREIDNLSLLRMVVVHKE